MSKFKGYAQASGFKNIQLPDRTKRIRQESERTISRMQRNFEIEQENTRAVMDALNDKYRIEEINRQFVFDLETENRNNIRNRMAENAEVVNKNNEIRTQQTQQLFESLSSLSTTAGTLAEGFLKERDEAGKAQGAQLANTIALAGGSYADILYMRQINKAHIANDEKFRSIVDRLIANGAPNDIVDQIRNANASTLYNLNKGLLVEAGIRYPEELARFETEALQLADGTDSEFTLGQARLQGNKFKELVEAQELRNRAGYIAQFQGKDNDPMVARYLYPKMIEAERANARGQAAAQLERTRRSDQLSYQESIRADYLDGGHQRTIAFIQDSENHAQARRDVLDQYIALASAGRFGNGSIESAWDEFQALMDTRLSIDGGRSFKTFGELYGNDPKIEELRSAIYSRDETLRKRLDAQKAVENARKEEDLLRFVTENYGRGGFDDNFMKILIERAQLEKIPTDNLKFYLSFNSSDAIKRREDDAFLAEEQRNGTLDLSDFEGINDPDLLEKYGSQLADLKADRDAMPRKAADVKQGFKDELLRALEQTDYQKVKGMSFSRALSKAMQLYNQQLAAADPTSTPAERQQGAEDYVYGLIAKFDDPNSPFYVIGRAGTGKESKEHAFFAKFQPGADNPFYETVDRGTAPLEVLDEVEKDPKFVLKEPFITKSLANDLARQIKSGKTFVIPPIFHQLASASNIPAHEIVAKQLELYDIKDVAVLPDVIQNIKSTVDSPELLQILNRPTSSNINTVAIASGNQVPFVRKGDDGYVDVQSLGRSLNFRSPDVMAAIWALETGRGRNVKGKNALFNVKSWDGTGTTTTTREYDANGNPYFTEATWKNFDTPAQAAQDFIDTVSKYPGVNESRTPREMVMAIAAGGYGTDPDYAQKVIDVLVGYGVNVDAPFVSYEGPVTRDPNYSSATLKHIYNVGSIGWGSTGPHLDLKQVDNPNTPDVDETGAYFKYDDAEIREYVFVDDRDLGMVPLSDVPMTGSWESHTSRGSNGYDYGIHDGRGIYIKPPARVVNSFRTSQNDDLLIIELPSGRRFKCHHGRRVND